MMIMQYEQILIPLLAEFRYKYLKKNNIISLITESQIICQYMNSSIPNSLTALDANNIEIWNIKASQLFYI